MSAILIGVANPESEAFRDSLVNWLRFNHRDIPNAAIYVALCVVLLVLAAGGTYLADHFLVHHYSACGTLGCHPGPAKLNHPPPPGTFPTFKP